MAATKLSSMQLGYFITTTPSASGKNMVNGVIRIVSNERQPYSYLLVVVGVFDEVRPFISDRSVFCVNVRL